MANLSANNIQEILIVQKTTKWMINLGIPIIVGLLGWNQLTLDKLKDADTLQQRDIAVLKEKVDNLEGVRDRQTNKEQTLLYRSYMPFMVFGEAILPKEEYLESIKNNKRSV